MKALLRGCALALLAGVLIVNEGQAAMGGSGALVGRYNEYGTVTIKMTITADSAASIGTDHKSADAVKTPFVSVPVGIPFWIWIEHRDADSSKAFAPDTVHIGLETAPAHSIASDSAGVVGRYEAACQMWDFSSLTWLAFRQQTFFDVTRVDTLNDTIAIAAASLKSGTANKATTPLVNLGRLRFSLCLDDQDSTTDSGIRFNVYIIYKAPAGGGEYQGYLDGGEVYGWRPETKDEHWLNKPQLAWCPDDLWYKREGWDY